MKIIIVEHRFHYSGPVAQRLLAYSKTFIAEGHEVVMIISSQTPVPSEINGARIVEISEVRERIIRCYFQFVRAIRKEYDGNSVIFFYEPQVYSFLFRAPRYRTFSEQTEIPNYGFNTSFLQKTVERVKLYAEKHFCGMTVISNRLKDYYVDRGVKEVEVINMFVDATRFEGISIEPPLEKYIAYCGTISVYKDGVDTLIKAFEVFSKKYPDYKLYLIGDFDKLGSESVIKELIYKNNLTEKVRFVGRVNADDMPSMLKGAQMLALSRPNNTQAQYGFPTKLGEYLATGKPVVVTKVGEIPLYLRDGDNAFLAEPGDVEAFANKMLEVADDYEGALIVAQRGKELVDSVFSARVQSAKFLDFIKRTI